MRLTNSVLRACSVSLVVGVLAVFLGGCKTGDKKAPPPNTAASANPNRIDPLQPGDALTIDFSGTPTPLPSVHTEIKGDGTVHLDFIGDVQAGGKTPGELERDIQEAYVPAYYTHLSVSVTPSGRWFFVNGEVMVPGRMLYAGPITVTRAIAAAQGFSPFADKKHVRLYRVNATSAINVNCIKAQDDPKLDLPVYPGDQIFVKRRFY